MADNRFPRPGMVAEGESSIPFHGRDVVCGFQPAGWNKQLGQETDYEHWGNTGIGGMKGPIEGASGPKPVNLFSMMFC